MLAEENFPIECKAVFCNVHLICLFSVKVSINCASNNFLKFINF